MKFMSTQSWYRLKFHEASPQYPHLFDLPDSETPAPHWFPLDQKAVDALKKLGPGVAQHKMVTGIDLTNIEVLEPMPVYDPDVPPAHLLKQQPDTLSGIQKAGRPADREPTK
jgi:hypothetical protein